MHTFEASADDDQPAPALARVRVTAENGASVPLWARLSRRSAHARQLAPDLPEWSQVTTVAKME